MFDPHVIIQAYTQGYFPMAHPDEGNAIFWHLPEIRGIIPLDERFKISKNLAKLYKKRKFELLQNHDFEGVIRMCSQRDDTWISEDIIDTYCQLHEMGVAHSFETWLDGNLVGGLYGLSIGKAFFGESMFHTVTNASKIGLMFLLDWINTNDFVLVDCQFMTEHLKQFGAKEISQKDYLLLLENALKIK